jgi:hypothetical protein
MKRSHVEKRRKKKKGTRNISALVSDKEGGG